jgi:hypothetical protein
VSVASDQIKEYLAAGGLFNPEMMNQTKHDAVRDTLIKARDDIQKLERENAALRQALEDMPTCRCGLSTDEQCALSVENAVLRKDSARLDYIFYPSCSMRARARMRKFIGTPEYLPGTGLCPWRAGIDAAMKEGQQ